MNISLLPVNQKIFFRTIENFKKENIIGNVISIFIRIRKKMIIHKGLKENLIKERNKDQQSIQIKYLKRS